MEALLVVFSYILTALFLLGMAGSACVIALTTVEEVGLFFGEDTPPSEGTGIFHVGDGDTPNLTPVGKP